MMLMLHGLSSAALLRAVILIITVTLGSTQYICYTQAVADGSLVCFSSTPQRMVETIEECCLTDGYFFERPGGSESCTACIVFGWSSSRGLDAVPRTTFTAVEQDERYVLPVGFIKGGIFVILQNELEFSIGVLEGTATANADYSVATESAAYRDFRTRLLVDAEIFLRADRVGLEDNETFSLILEAEAGSPAEQFLTMAQTDTFVNLMIEITIVDVDVVTVQFELPEYTAMEDQDMSVNVLLIGNVATSIILRVVPENLTVVTSTMTALPQDLPEVPQNNPRLPVFATSEEDFSASPVNIIFEAGGITNITVQLTLVDDDINEIEQAFVAFLELQDAINPALVNISDARFATYCRIIDNDPLSIGFEQTSYTFNETTDSVLNNEIPIISLNNRITELTFQVRTEVRPGDDSPATPDEDFIPGSELLDFSSGETTAFGFTILDDIVPEETESFALMLSLPEQDALLGAVSVGAALANVFIEDDDVFIIGFEQAFSTVNESVESLELCIRVTNVEDDQELGVTIPLAVSTIPGSAGHSTGDYQELDLEPIPELSGLIHRVCFNVAIVDDTLFERTEMFSVVILEDPSLGRLPPRTILLPDVSVIEIIDNDRVRIGFRQVEYTVSEDSSTVAVEVAVEEGDFQGSISVNLTTSDGSANSGSDYTSVMSTLVFDVDTRSILVDIDITDDGISEQVEVFGVGLQLNSPDSPRIDISPDSATVTILNDDNVTIGFVQTLYSVNERDSSVELCVELRDGMLERDAIVTFSTVDDSATSTAIADYTAVTMDFTFDSDNSRHCVNVSIVDDNILEDTEVFFGSLTSTDLATVLNPDRTEVQIVEDSADSVTIGFEQPQYSATEGIDASVEVCASVLDGMLDREAIVTFFTTDGSATSTDPVDYTAVSVELTFSPGSPRNCQNIPIEDDDILEGVENLFASLTTSDPDVILAPDGTEILIIQDPNDSVTIGFEPVTYSVEEGLAVEVCARILSGTLEIDAIVILASGNGEAEAPEDFLEVSEVLTFTPTEARQCQNVMTINDNTAEFIEEFFLGLSTGQSGVNLDPNLATVIIFDNDDLLIGFEETTYSVEEGLQVEVCVIVIASLPSMEIFITLSSADFDAVAPGDYTAIAEDLTFSASETRICRNVISADDDILEDDEDLLLTLTTSDGAVFLEPSTATVTILNDDTVTIGFEQLQYSATEGIDASVEVCALVLDGMLERVAIVTFFTTDGSATSDVPMDYTAVSVELTFSTGSLRNCQNIPIEDDSDSENDEEFFLGLSTGQSGVSLDPDAATVTILDNDVIAEIGLEQGSYTVGEGAGSLEVCVSSQRVDRVVEVTLSTEDGTAVAPMDYLDITEALIFDSVTPRICRTVTIVDDGDQETNEFFTLRLTTSDSSLILNPASGTVTIIDNEGVLVNDTIIGDPLFAVPLLLSEPVELALDGGDPDRVILCYEIHGKEDLWFNLVTDECTSVNAHYSNVAPQLNIINRIAVRAVDDDGACREIAVDVDGCSIEVDGMPVNFSRNSNSGIRIRKYPQRVRILVPNCAEQSLIMWITCESRILEDIDTELLRFDVLRGLNFGHRNSHGLIGQFWNVPVIVSPFVGNLRDGETAEGYYIINVTRVNAPTRLFTGFISPLAWDYSPGPCLNAGNSQGGPVYEIEDPNDPVIEGRYRDYIVPGAFDETGYIFGRFEDTLCLP